MNKKYFMFMRGVLGFGAICFSFGFGYILSYSSWDEEISIVRHKTLYSRGLASLDGEKEITTISDSFLDVQNLFKQARQVSASDHTLFHVGNIISVDLHGNKNFVCDVYSQVHFSFEADGIFQRGEPVTMLVHSSCKTDENNRFIGPFSIPSQKILNSPLSQKNFSTTDGEIFFNNVDLNWPKSWILREVTFQSVSQNQYRVEAQIPQTEEENFFTIEF